VGKAATASFVYSFVLILITDLALDIILDGVYKSWWPEGVKLLSP
jgi:phospholipid/cholesterol/gamma-HCH transport system permease protein